MPLSRKRSPHWKCRITIISSVLIFTLICTFLTSQRFKSSNGSGSKRSYYDHKIRKYITAKTVLKTNKLLFEKHKYGQFRDFEPENSSPTHRLKDSFDFEKCHQGFKIFVYPVQYDHELSPMYQKILKAISTSSYITDDPSKACLFLPSIDTHDRDVLSKNFVKNIDSYISQQKHWNGGRNHIIINLYSGTWPNYVDNTVGFDIGKAQLLKASYSFKSLRQSMDLSIPLIPNNHPLRSLMSTSILKNETDNPELNVERNIHLFPVRRKYLLAFKGKRYLAGIGSETRDSLHLLHNGKDIILLTTCKHNGKEWESIKDSRCDEDNLIYNQYDYMDLLVNSTFCLVPRGRRLGSFRFLETMKYGCIPVILSNGWDLPFSEVLDWSKFSLNIDERLVLQIPSILQKISDDEILFMRQQTLFIYQAYFESIEKIMHTSLEILQQRIYPQLRHENLIWNQPPGALKVDADFTTSPLRLPYYTSFYNMKPIKKFTAVILAVSAVYRSSSSLFQLIKSINLSNFLDQILVIWLASANIPDKTKWPQTQVTLRVIHPPKKTMNARYVDMDLIKTDAVFALDEDVIINQSEVDFAFSVWLSNPSQLVGFSTASHYFDSQWDTPSWRYTSKQMNRFSIVHTSAGIYHRYYNHMYSKKPPPGLHKMVERERDCESLAMNFLISSLSGKPAIKVARSAQFSSGNPIKERLDASFTMKQFFEKQQRCFSELISIFNDLPLIFSGISMNPVLYKDPVSISRKKYRTLE